MDISGAFLLAQEAVNNCSCEFKFIFDKEKDLKNTTRNEKIATKASIDLIDKNNVAALIGPEGPNCHYSAMVAAAMDRLMISYG